MEDGQHTGHSITHLPHPHKLVSISVAIMTRYRERGRDQDRQAVHPRPSQAVRLPKEFRLPGKEVRVTRVGHRVILEPIARSPADVAAVFAEIDRLLTGEPFPDVRPADDPPVVPDKRVFFDA